MILFAAWYKYKRSPDDTLNDNETWKGEVVDKYKRLRELAQDVAHLTQDVALLYILYI